MKTPTEAFIILIDGSPRVGIPRSPGDPSPFPSDILDAYSVEYGIERERLTWGLARFIEMPMLRGFNNQ